MQISPGSVARAPAPGASRASAPPMWRNWSMVTVGPRPEPGPTFAISSSIVSAGSRSRSWCVRWNGTGSSGSMARSPSTTGGTVANVSRAGPRSAQRPQQRAALGLAAEKRRHHDGERAPAGERRHVGDRREVHQRRPRHELVGQRGQQRAPGVQHLGRALEREEHRSGVELVDRVDGELDRGHDAEVAAAAAQRPEQVGVVLGVRAHEAAVGGDELERGHGVGLQPVLAGQPAHAAAERVAGDPDVRRRAVQARQAVGREPRRDAIPLDAGADADALGPGVDADLLERADVQQQGVVQVAERTLVVGGRLGRDAQSGAARVGDRRRDVLARRRETRPPPGAGRAGG